MNLKTTIRIGMIAFLLIIFAGGYFYHSMLWNAFLKNALYKAMLHNEIVANSIDTHLDDQQKAVAMISKVPAWHDALKKDDPQSLNLANAFLDHSQKTLGASVVFLLDHQGKVIASSNRQSTDSFVGHNYSFRPYFQTAIQGVPAIYFAYGVTSKLPGAFFSAPVPDPDTGAPIGVLAIKGEVNTWQEYMRGDDPHDITTLTDPHGIVFLASRKEWTRQSLWEIAPETHEEIIKTRQFGDATVSWDGLVRLDKQHARDNAGNHFIIHERNLKHYPGWRIVCLENEKGLSQQYFAPMLINAGLVIIPVCGLLGTLVFILYRRAANELMTRELTEDKLRTITATANDAIIMIDDHGCITFWNLAAQTIFGYKQEEVLGRSLHAFLAPPRYRPGYAEHFPHFVQTGQGNAIGKTLEMQGLTSIGQEIPIELSLSSVKIMEKWHAVGIVRDISRRKQAEEKLRESEERFRGSFESAAIGMALVDLSGRFFKVNNSLCGMFGYTETELLALRFQDITHPDDIEPDLAFVRKMLAGEITHYHMEKRSIHKAGHTVWIQLAVSLVRDVQSQPLYFVSQIADITEQKQSLEKIVHLAHHDALTGVPNRILFQDRLNQTIARAHRTKRPFALLYLDLDGFKAINDSLGHEQGDALLRKVADRLRDTVRESDTVARIGGDEFTVILDEIDDAGNTAPVTVAEKIVAVLGRPFELPGHDCKIGVSIGVAIYPQDGHDANTLISHADGAMYQVKAEGKNGYACWSGEKYS